MVILIFILEKRGRDRELDYKTYNKKAKTRERSSSEEEHKDADRLYDKRYAERDSQRRSMLEKERRFGDWKEMISKGSGKKYYYNERDKSSQWEKPEEWMEYDLYDRQIIYLYLVSHKDPFSAHIHHHADIGRRNVKGRAAMIVTITVAVEEALVVNIPEEILEHGGRTILMEFSRPRVLRWAITSGTTVLASD